MAADAVAEARSILSSLQAGVDARSADGLRELFDERSVLIGSSGDGRDEAGLRAYLTAVAEGEPFRWEWEEIVPFHEADGELGFAAFGEIAAGEQRFPIRATIFAVTTPAGWKMRQFHGSIPFAPG